MQNAIDNSTHTLHDLVIEVLEQGVRHGCGIAHHDKKMVLHAFGVQLGVVQLLSTKEVIKCRQ